MKLPYQQKVNEVKWKQIRWIGDDISNHETDVTQAYVFHCTVRTRCVWTNEEITTFLPLVQETNINAIRYGEVRTNVTIYQ